MVLMDKVQHGLCVVPWVRDAQHFQYYGQMERCSDRDDCPCTGHIICPLCEEKKHQVKHYPQIDKLTQYGLTQMDIFLKAPLPSK